MKQCFVIQPFSGDFDKRYFDTFEPAIKKAELEPYRVDKDLSSSIPINDIEEKIRESTLCFADISIDNPNVWYELGYAFACGKNVVMICTEERTKFPFDIQHKTIIRYKTGSKSDFEKLESDISSKLKSYLNKVKNVETLNSNLIKETEGLQAHEITFLTLLMSNIEIIGDSYSITRLKQEMIQSGYNNLGSTMALHTLEKKGYISTNIESNIDSYGNEYSYNACKITQWGIDWIFSNQDKLKLNIQNNKLGDDLPF